MKQLMHDIRGSGNARAEIEGIHRCSFVTGHVDTIWRYRTPVPLSVAELDEDLIKQTGRTLRERGEMVVLDIEHLTTSLMAGSDTEVERSSDLMIRTTDLIRSVAPGLAVGYFRIMPVAQHWLLILAARHAGTPEGEHWAAKVAEWRRANARLRMGRRSDTGRYEARGMADTVDFVTIRAYQFAGTTHAEWRIVQDAQLAESRRYQKRVLACIMPELHDRSPMAASEFMAQLEYLLDHDDCDGVILWYHSPQRSLADIQAEAWYQAFVQFARQIGEVA